MVCIARLHALLVRAGILAPVEPIRRRPNNVNYMATATRSEAVDKRVSAELEHELARSHRLRRLRSRNEGTNEPPLASLWLCVCTRALTGCVDLRLLLGCRCYGGQSECDGTEQTRTNCVFSDISHVSSRQWFQ